MPERDAGDLLEQRLEIETPERVVLVHELAGLGGRFAAGTIDVCCLAVPWLVATCAMLGIRKIGDTSNEEEMRALAMAEIGVCYAIAWLYYLLFESLWGGRTPGKRMMRLRVVSVHGGPAPVSAIVLRNVLRVVDSLPTLIPPVLGGVVMFLNRRGQRIGDIAAGTVVVRERPERLRARPSAPASAGDALSATDLDEVQRFLDRRGELLPEARRNAAVWLVARLSHAYRLPPGDPEVLLGLLGSGRTPQQVRDLAGPRSGGAA